ncbi:uncharacterized protein LOC117334390 [Pecten maximus]|uniref:uncharacterized protein LOC117334390 n=1 Tax=Pecten maximus TaxID=6579 RepID=UPI00145818D7|nr:uncharacterized protein LOC117334390 [Pecten maximus]XP_033749876.1 uncharacterized protein LOC117334390 [Pecten maximus]XP_033749877.1 uncharacterized protein LOC117334390 [Pecten maximus]XP_033749878.1 uncharacterized protein LOC117334390 [Pecten maximus]XP_033749879.1 uncharacterized protein LOC117334390 [Pecten maximus]XP_033749880.1 uncharacterized protein LOC117334390 [Pecten maximus]XP_033749881.1 uncharacterized protein LOC117334390 [Pecten maximus]
MAVTSLNGTEQTISAFVQDIIRYARQKVEDGEGNINKMEEGSDESRDLTTSGHLCNGDATEEEIRDKDEQTPPPSGVSNVVIDKSQQVNGIGDDTQPECLDCQEQLIAPRAEVEQFIAPRAEVDVTDLDDPEIIESQDQKDADLLETTPITTHDNNENDDDSPPEAIMVVHPNGNTQTVVDYINDIIEAARKRACEEATDDLNTTSKKGKKKKKSGDAGKQGSRRGSSRSGAVRELITRLFRRDDSDNTSEGNGLAHSQPDTSPQGNSTPDKAQPKKNKSNKRPHFKNILFQKKQKYQVSTEALATDENSREKIKKRHKVSRANSFGKSLRNILSCSSSVTTV